MDYDLIREIEDLGDGAKEPFFASYIRPLLATPVTNPEELAYFYDAAFNAWKLGINRKQIINTRLVSALLEELCKQDEAYLVEIIREMLAQQRAVAIREEADERNAYNARISKNVERIFNDLLEQYKGMFENEFRHWATIPYAYVVRIQKKWTKPARPADFLHISGGTKFLFLSSDKTQHPNGDLKDLIVGFDNEIRNAGGGHDGYEITDKETVILHVRDPHTGAYKGKGKIELSQDELQELIQECRRTIWSLEIGFALFMHDNLEFSRKCILQRTEKLREIKVYMTEYAKTLSLILSELEISEDRETINLIIKYKPAVLGEGGHLLMPSQAYDLIKREDKVSYKEQFLRLIQVLLIRFFSLDKIPIISAKVYNERSEQLADLTLEPPELVRLFDGKKAGIPLPSVGQYPEGMYKLFWETPVPLGLGRFVKELIK